MRLASSLPPMTLAAAWSAAALLVAAVLGGGRQDAVPPSPAPSIERAEAKEPDPPQPAEVAPPVDQPQPVVNSDPPDAQPAYTWPDDGFRQRVLLLAPGGPLVMDLWLTVDAEQQLEQVEQLLDAALELSDANGDGRAAWREWRSNDKFFSRFAAGQQPNRQQLQQWEDLYDRNRNRRIDRNEMASWLGRDWGHSLQVLSLRSSRGGGANTDSRLWRLLDTDSSGGLSVEEIERTTDVLWSLDADDDRTLASDELQPLEEQLAANQNNANPRRRGSLERHAALHFGGFFDWGRLSYLLADLYSPRHSLTSKSFADLPNLFAELDSSDDQQADGWLSEGDFARLADVEPHIRLAVAFASGDSESAAIEQLELSTRVERLQLLAEPSAARCVLSLGTSRIVLAIRDLVPAAGNAPELQAAQTQMMVHDNLDPLYEFVDTNADGRLGEREVQSAAVRLAECDTNGDGLLVAGELPYTLLVAIQRGEDPAARNFYVPAMRAASAVAGPDWFVAADFNADGDLSPREFLGSPETFQQLDEDGNGFIDAEEAVAAGG